MFNSKNKLIFGSLTIFLAVFLVACQRDQIQDLNLNTNDETPITNNEGQAEEQQIIGGEKDAHGCLIASGYFWCQSKNKCLRSGEETCPAEKDDKQSIVLEDLNWKKYSKKNNWYSDIC